MRTNARAGIYAEKIKIFKKNKSQYFRKNFFEMFLFSISLFKFSRRAIDENGFDADKISKLFSTLKDFLL